MERRPAGLSPSPSSTPPLPVANPDLGPLPSRTVAGGPSLDSESGALAKAHLSLDRLTNPTPEPDPEDTSDTATLSPRDEISPTNATAHQFETIARPGDVILSWGDGVFELHCSFPETCHTLADLESSSIRFSGEVDAYADALSQDTLMGMRGNLVGPDKIAIVAPLVRLSTPRANRAADLALKCPVALSPTRSALDP